MKNTAIEWAHHTFNPWMGCTKVSPGCDHCYAENLMDSRTHVVQWGTGKPRKRTGIKNWNDPLRWNAEAKSLGVRYRVFCASLADVFDNEVPEHWRGDLFRVIHATPHLDWLLLTKRIGNARAMMNCAASAADGVFVGTQGWDQSPWPNVWLGATICNQAEADRDIPKLLATPAARRFLSIEPLLGDIRLGSFLHRSPGAAFDAGKVTPDMPAWTRIGSTAIDWVIVGGESGTHARPMHPDWVRSLRDECLNAGVPFLFKQWGEHDLSYDRDLVDPDWRKCKHMDGLPGRWINVAGDYGFHGARVHFAQRVGKKRAGRLLDGRTWDEVPS